MAPLENRRMAPPEDGIGARMEPPPRREPPLRASPFPVYARIVTLFPRVVKRLIPPSERGIDGERRSMENINRTGNQ